ncbi:MAG: hypothetical protein HRT71_04010 [Flavobacteriales bacterium]|nr:hypothetical protein [Flavobacteriales bacterium]
MKNLIALSVMLVILNSCISEQQDIVVQGRILDAKTDKPISNAEVVALCWYQNNLDDVSFKKQNTITNSEGVYQFKFEDGYKIDIASKAQNYIPSRTYNKLANNELTKDLKLNKSRKNKSLIVKLTAMNIPKDNEETPYLRQRVYSNPETKELDFTTTESWGYDFVNSKNTVIIDSADIWLKSVSKEEHSTILITSNKGGLVPIYSSEIDNTLLFEKLEAPQEGYLTEYQLTGNEEGFFVRCRDGVTYGKLIMEKSKIDISSPHAKGYFKEWGYNFSSLYQPDSSRRFDYYLNIDLEDFLVDYRYK